jgi:predicted tellurium resistance membrane protein TerC
MELVIALLALTAMEIVLGIDNIVFITIISGRLPKEQQPLARRLGLIFAMVTRLALLFSLFYLVKGEQFQQPVFKLTNLGVSQRLIERMTYTEDFKHLEVDEDVVNRINQKHFDESNGVSIKDLILLFGGLFLVAKSVYEIHDEFHHASQHAVASTRKAFVAVLAQIAFLDIVFSLDSVITAVGMVDNVWVMVASIVIAIIVMLMFAEPISRFVETHPTLKMLALSFLILIGVMLVAEGVGAHLDKGYIYFAMFFALVVEFLNISLRVKPKTSPST